MSMMRAYSIAGVGLLALSSGFACSSGSGSPASGSSSGGGSGSGSGAACNPCDDGGSGVTPVPGGTDLNPDGVAYPTPAAGYGRSARLGSKPGSIIQNFKFLGYPSSDPTKSSLQTISLANFYDPCNKRYKVLHITVAGVWCQPCNMETDALVAAKSMLDSEQVVVIQALDDGPIVGTPATKMDLDYWVKNHMVNFTEMLDPGLQNLGGFFDAAAIPWNADIDVRTMEILDAAVGFSDVTTELAPALQYVKEAPGYKVDVTCP